MRLNKQGLPWAIATIEDFSGSIEVLFFPRQYEGVQEVLAQDQIVAVTGRVGIRDDQASMTGNNIRILELRDRSDMPVEISLSAQRCTPALLRELRETLTGYPGSVRVRVHLRDRSKETTIDLGDQVLVEPNSSFYAAVKGLLGASAVS